MVRTTLLIVIINMILTCCCTYAVEVRNLRTGQDGKRAFVQYDLVGKPGEMLADVMVGLDISGERYASDRLSVSGDFGKNVKVGIGRRIYWDLLKDLPAGFDGEIGWDVEASSTAEYLALVKEQKNKSENDKTARDSMLKKMAEQQKTANDKITKENTVNETGERRQAENIKAVQALPIKSDGKIETPFAVSELTVTDSSSGLIWLRKLDKPMLSKDVLQYCDKINKSNYGGYSDWRLPTAKELEQLVSLAKNGGWGDKEGHYISDYLNIAGFVNVSSEYGYTSSIRHATGFSTLKVIRLWSGYTDDVTISGMNTDKFSVFLVRDKKESDLTAEKGVDFEFTDLIAKDKGTGLVWLRDAVKPIKWTGVEPFITQLNLNKVAGYTDWRLPTESELKKIVSYATTKGWGNKEGRYVSDFLNSSGFNNITPEYAPTGNINNRGYLQISVIRMWSGYSDEVKIGSAGSDTLFSVLAVRGQSDN